jgi:hypothetical protein
VTAHLLHLDPGRLVDGKAADARAEGDQRQCLRAKLVRLASALPSLCG